MTSRIGLLLCHGRTAGPCGAGWTVRAGTPQLVDADTSAWCVVPATFQSGGVSKRVLYLSVSSGIAVKPEGEPSRVIYYRAALKGGEQRPRASFGNHLWFDVLL